MAKTLSILGVTGSIGQSTMDVVLSQPDAFDVKLVSAHQNVEALAEAAVKIGAEHAVIADETCLEALKHALEGSGVKAYGGREALLDLAAQPVDLTMAAIVGMAGLEPLMAAMPSSKAVAIANKEPLVAAGPLVLEAAQQHNTQLLPVDSEHNAIFQVFEQDNRKQIERIILTASGGPFRTWSLDEMARATPDQAVAHPNWSMGQKISIDSATMMNKALEVIEAHYLFEMPADQIDVLIHPQSAIHSMVKYADGSILAQMGASDMCTPIAYALAYPDRMSTPGRKLDLTKMKSLDFEAVDDQKFPAIKRSYQCLEKGLPGCIALNAANEVAVDAFLNTELPFLGIMEVIDYVLETVNFSDSRSLSDIIHFDSLVRECAQDYIKNSTIQTKKVI